MPPGASSESILAKYSGQNSSPTASIISTLTTASNSPVLVAVVAHRDLDPVGHPGGVDPLLGQRGLLDRQGHRGHGRAALGGPDGERAPAGADLEHPGARR